MNEIDTNPTTDLPIPPQPVKDGALWSVVRTAGVVLAAGGVGLLLFSATAGQTMGASRSCRRYSRHKGSASSSRDHRLGKAPA